MRGARAGGAFAGGARSQSDGSMQRIDHEALAGGQNDFVLARAHRVLMLLQQRMASPQGT